MLRAVAFLESLLARSPERTEVESKVLRILQKKKSWAKWSTEEFFLFHEGVSEYGLDYAKLQAILP